MSRTPVFNDPFSPAGNGTALETYDANWAVIDQGGGYATINNSKLDLNFANGARVLFRRVGTYTADQYAAATLGGFGINLSTVGVTVRMSTDTGAGADYFALDVHDYSTGTMDTELYKVVNGTKTSIDLRSSITWVNGDILSLEVTGTSPSISLACYRNGTAYFTATSQSGQDTGNPGVTLSGNSHCLTMDDYEAGNVGAAAATPSNTRRAFPFSILQH